MWEEKNGDLIETIADFPRNCCSSEFPQFCYEGTPVGVSTSTVRTKARLFPKLKVH